jgi:hypothetical protein
VRTRDKDLRVRPRCWSSSACQVRRNSDSLRPSERFDRHVRALLEKSRPGSLNPQEEEEWARDEFLEHLGRMAKTRAGLKLGIVPGADA